MAGAPPGVTRKDRPHKVFNGAQGKCPPAAAASIFPAWHINDRATRDLPELEAFEPPCVRDFDEVVRCGNGAPATRETGKKPRTPAERGHVDFGAGVGQRVGGGGAPRAAAGGLPLLGGVPVPAGARRHAGGGLPGARGSGRRGGRPAGRLPGGRGLVPPPRRGGGAARSPPREPLEAARRRRGAGCFDRGRRTQAACRRRLPHARVHDADPALARGVRAAVLAGDAVGLLFRFLERAPRAGVSAQHPAARRSRSGGGSPRSRRCAGPWASSVAGPRVAKQVLAVASPAAPR